VRQDERTPLSAAKLRQRLLEEHRYNAINSFVPLSFVTLLAIVFTAIICKFCAVSLLLFWGLLAIGALPFWIGASILAYRAWKAIRSYRGLLHRDFLRIDTDTVSELAEESELHYSGRAAYQDKAYVVYLEKHGRYVIGSTLWNILKEGDEVYVAVTIGVKTEVYRVYSARTHRIVHP
jgi:hypothetical protein